MCMRILYGRRAHEQQRVNGTRSVSDRPSLLCAAKRLGAWTVQDGCQIRGRLRLGDDRKRKKNIGFALLSFERCTTRTVKSRARAVYTLNRLRPVRGSFDPFDTRSITRGEKFENGVSRQSCDVCLAVHPGSTRLFISII
ncbi:hypothetical protein QTP88_014474 [Uroleucon formosanum]